MSIDNSKKTDQQQVNFMQQVIDINVRQGQVKQQE